ncbi:hypothetical protein [Clostridium sp. YIM B02506]
MKLGEVGLLTNDVIRLANFYKKLLGMIIIVMTVYIKQLFLRKLC